MCVVSFRALRAHLVWNTRVDTGVPLEQSSVPAFQNIYGGGRGFPRGLRCVSIPVFQHLATIANPADNVCVVTFRALRDDLVWNTRLAQLCQWHTRVFQRVSTLQPSQVPLKNVRCDFESLHDEWSARAATDAQASTTRDKKYESLRAKVFSQVTTFFSFTQLGRLIIRLARVRKNFRDY